MTLLFALLACSETEVRGPEERPIVPLDPEPTLTEVQERYLQFPVPRVDVLFVVDNSSSMGDEQAALAENFPRFLTYFQQSALDWHIGVVATDVQRAEYTGRLRTFDGYHWVDEDTVNPEQVFSGMTSRLGVITGSQESGREAAWTTLELRRDHPDNVGFYRDAAQLHIVFVTDTYDNSDQPSTEEFLQWARNLKPDGQAVVLHAIVQLPNDQACTGWVRPGVDYISYANQTGGVVGSVCEQDWSPVLDALGLQSTGDRQEFFLQNLPALEEPIELRVVTHNSAGVEVTLQFEVCMAGDELTDPECEAIYTPGRNSLVFLDYVVEAGDEVLVTYTRREDYAP